MADKLSSEQRELLCLFDLLFNPLSANPTKWSNTLKQFVGKLQTNCLSVFDHFVGLVHKGLMDPCVPIDLWKALLRALNYGLEGV